MKNKQRKKPEKQKAEPQKASIAALVLPIVFVTSDLETNDAVKVVDQQFDDFDAGFIENMIRQRFSVSKETKIKIGPFVPAEHAPAMVQSLVQQMITQLQVKTGLAVTSRPRLVPKAPRILKPWE